MDRRNFLRGLIGAAAVAAGSAAMLRSAEAVPLSPGKLPAMPAAEGLANAVTDTDEAAALKAETVQYRRRRRRPPPRYRRPPPPPRYRRRRRRPGVYLRF